MNEAASVIESFSCLLASDQSDGDMASVMGFSGFGKCYFHWPSYQPDVNIFTKKVF